MNMNPGYDVRIVEGTFRGWEGEVVNVGIEPDR